MDLWRISRFVSLDGEGGRRAPGRWHSTGQPIVYLAASPSGALQEHLAHLELNARTFPEKYQLLRIHVPDSLHIVPLSPHLEKRWTQSEDRSRELGDHWLTSLASCLAAVPSAIIPYTQNYLLNPEHADAAAVTIVEAMLVVYDRRLFKLLGNE